MIPRPSRHWSRSLVRPAPSEQHLTISSPQNERIKGVRRLQRARERRATGRTLLEGPHLLEAALTSGVVPELVFVTEAGARPDTEAEILEVTESVLQTISATDTPRGPLAVIAIPEPDPLRAEPTVVLWEVSTPGNAGTLIRTAAALGWNVAIRGGADPWSPKVLRAAAGAHFAVPIARVDSVAELTDAGLHTVAGVAKGGDPLEAIETTRPIALFIGNESHGLPAAVIEAADAALTIPTPGVESLNAAVAGAIAMYALGR